MHVFGSLKHVSAFHIMIIIILLRDNNNKCFTSGKMKQKVKRHHSIMLSEHRMALAMAYPKDDSYPYG